MQPFDFDLTYADSLDFDVGTCGNGEIEATTTILHNCQFFALPGQTSPVYFTSADIGCVVAIGGAGPVDPLTPLSNGLPGATLWTTIVSINSSTSVNVADAATTTVSAIGNVTVFRRCLVQLDTLVYQSSIAPGTRDTLDCKVLATEAYFIRNQVICAGQPVLLHSADLGTIFGGLIDQCTDSNQSQPGSGGMTPPTNAAGSSTFSYTLKCTSWDSIASRRVVDPRLATSFVNTAAGTVFAKIALTYLDAECIAVSKVAGPNIDIQVPAGSYVSDLLNQVCSLANGADPTHTYFWKTDAHKTLIFANETTTAAPWNVDNDILLTAANAQTTHNQYANEIFVVAQKMTGDPYNVTFIGNGTQTSFPMPLNIEFAPVITLNGGPQTVGIVGVDTGKDWYWSQGSPSISQDATGTVLTAADSLLVVTVSVQPGIATAVNNAGLTEREVVEGLGAVYQYSTQVTAPITRDDLLAYAEALAASKGIIPGNVQATTLRGGLATGQQQSIILDSINTNGTFLISQVRMTSSMNVVYWDYSAISGSNIGVGTTGLVQFINRGQAALSIITPTPPVASSFGFSRSIVIDHTQVSGGADLTDFVFSFAGTFPWLATLAHGGFVHSSNGYDIVFATDSGGQFIQNFDLDFYDPTTGQCSFWVRIPTLSHTVDTTLYICYGSASVTSSLATPGFVWSPNADSFGTPNANFHGVYHLNETTGPYHDSTKYANNSTGHGGHGVTGYPSQTAGYFGKGQSFAGAQGITLQAVLNGDGFSNFTGSISCWINSTVASGGARPFWDTRITTGGQSGTACAIDTGVSGEVLFYKNNGSSPDYFDAAPAVNDGNWHYVVFTFSPSGCAGYIDGVHVGNTASGLSVAFDIATQMYIGATEDANTPFSGVMDEHHWTQTQLSAGWIATEYNNQKTGQTFYIVGSGASPVPVNGNPQGTVTHTTGALTAGEPIFGNGGADIKPGTKTGTTAEVVTATGTPANGKPLIYDSSGDAAPGDTHQLVIPGGTAGQVLSKNSSTDFDTSWATPAGGGTVTHTGALTSNLPVLGNGSADVKIGVAGQLVPAGGSSGEVLAKSSGTDYDTAWTSPSGLSLEVNGTPNGDQALLNLKAGTNVTLTDDGVGGVTIAASGGGGSGGLVLLEQHTASSSASLDFTSAISSTYDEYVIECVNVVPATNGVNLVMRCSTNGGSSYDSGSNYFWDGGSWRAGAGFAVGGGTDTSISLTAANGLSISNDSKWGVCATLRLYNPLSTGVYKQVIGKAIMIYVSTTIRVMIEIGGQYTSLTAVNAFQFLFSSGNIASGTIRVYGLAK